MKSTTQRTIYCVLLSIDAFYTNKGVKQQQK